MARRGRGSSRSASWITRPTARRPQSSATPTGTGSSSIRSARCSTRPNRGYVSDPARLARRRARRLHGSSVGGDDRGTVKVVDTSRKVTTLTSEYWGEEGPCLVARRAHRVPNFLPSDSNAQFDVDAVNVSGTPVVRQVVAGPGSAFVADVETGRPAAAGARRPPLRHSGAAHGDTAERNLSWLDFPLQPTLSRDGRHMAFGDLSQSAGTDYAVALRDIAADKVVRLGPGMNGASACRLMRGGLRPRFPRPPGCCSTRPEPAMPSRWRIASISRSARSAGSRTARRSSIAAGGIRSRLAATRGRSPTARPSP